MENKQNHNIRAQDAPNHDTRQTPMPDAMAFRWVFDESLRKNKAKQQHTRAKQRRLYLSVVIGIGVFIYALAFALYYLF